MHLIDTVARMDSVVEVTEVRVQANLHFVSLDFETKRGPLFQALSSGASVCMYSMSAFSVSTITSLLQG